MYQAGVAAALYAHLRTLARSSQGLWLYHVLERTLGQPFCQRVNGVHSGGIYAGDDNKFYGHRKLDKPSVGHHSWKELRPCSLDSMPRPATEHYRNVNRGLSGIGIKTGNGG